MLEEIENPYTQIDKLVHAVQFGDFPFIETAISVHHVSPDFVDAQNCSLLHWAAINNRVQIAEFLIAQQANVNKAGGDGGEIPLQWAVRYARCLPMVQLLLNEKSDVNHKSSSGYDSLYLAVMANQVHISFLLLNAGANPDTIDTQRDSAIIWLLRHRNLQESYEALELLRLLIAFHADVSQAGQGGNNALHILCATTSKNFIRENTDSTLLGNRRQPGDFSFDVAELLYRAVGSSGRLSLLNARNDQDLTPWSFAYTYRHPAAMRFFVDMYMNTQFSRYFPVLAVALHFASFFPLIQYFGYFLGIFFTFMLGFVTEALRQGSIPSGQGRISCGFTWGIILSIAGTYYSYLSTYYSDPVTYYGISALLTVICYTLTKAMITPAVKLVDKGPVHRAEIATAIANSKPIHNAKGEVITHAYKLCTTCLVDKIQASIHCKHCGACVIDLDHHCPFVDGCVGKGNRRVFVLFTLTAAWGCAWVGWLSLLHEYAVLCPAGTIKRGWFWGFFSVQYCAFTSPRSSRAIACETILSLLCALWIGGLCLQQLAMIAGETTTFEMIKRHNHGRSIFALRAVRNLYTFCLTGQYTVCEKNAHSSSSSSAPSLQVVRRFEDDPAQHRDEGYTPTPNSPMGHGHHGSSHGGFGFGGSSGGKCPFDHSHGRNSHSHGHDEM